MNLHESFGLKGDETFPRERVVAAWRRFFEIVHGQLSGTPFVLDSPGTPSVECFWFLDSPEWDAGVFLFEDEPLAGEERRLLHRDGRLHVDLRRNLASARLTLRNRLEGFIGAADPGYRPPDPIRSLAIFGPPLPGRHGVYAAWTSDFRESNVGTASDEGHLSDICTSDRRPKLGRSFWTTFAPVYLDGKPTSAVAVANPVVETIWNTGAMGTISDFALIGRGIFRLDWRDAPRFDAPDPLAMPSEEARRSSVGRAYHAALWELVGHPPSVEPSDRAAAYRDAARPPVISPRLDGEGDSDQ